MDAAVLKKEPKKEALDISRNSCSDAGKNNVYSHKNIGEMF